jgi:hypothetical protein
MITDEDRERLERLDGPIHEWFGLTYSNYLVLQRSQMQSMNVYWQKRMVRLLNQLDEAFADHPHAPGFQVRARDHSGRFTKDPVPPYDRGRTFLPPKGDEDLVWQRPSERSSMTGGGE